MKYFILISVFILQTRICSSSVEFSDEDFFYLSDGRVIDKKKWSSSSHKKIMNISQQFIKKSNFIPTIVTKWAEIQDYFDLMRQDYHDKAQCTNMAHVWAYEEFKRSGLRSEKIFIFFSRKYIKKYRFGWWFHVAPIIRYSDGEKIQSIVLDRGYTTMPFDIKTWTDHFIKSKKTCKFINRISTYYQNKLPEDCFLMKVSMYFWQPRDIRLNESSGKVKTYFLKSDLSHAYREAFNFK